MKIMIDPVVEYADILSPIEKESLAKVFELEQGRYGGIKLEVILKNDQMHITGAPKVLTGDGDDAMECCLFRLGCPKDSHAVLASTMLELASSRWIAPMLEMTSDVAKFLHGGASLSVFIMRSGIFICLDDIASFVRDRRDAILERPESRDLRAPICTILPNSATSNHDCLMQLKRISKDFHSFCAIRQKDFFQCESNLPIGLRRPSAKKFIAHISKAA